MTSSRALAGKSSFCCLRTTVARVFSVSWSYTAPFNLFRRLFISPISPSWIVEEGFRFIAKVETSNRGLFTGAILGQIQLASRTIAHSIPFDDDPLRATQMAWNSQGSSMFRRHVMHAMSLNNSPALIFRLECPPMLVRARRCESQITPTEEKIWQSQHRNH